MSKYYGPNTKHEVGILLLVITFVLGIFALLSMWTDRNLDFWATYIADKPVDIPFWLSFLLTLVLNGLAIIGNLLMELARFFV